MLMVGDVLAPPPAAAAERSELAAEWRRLGNPEVKSPRVQLWRTRVGKECSARQVESKACAEVCVLRPGAEALDCAMRPADPDLLRKLRRDGYVCNLDRCFPAVAQATKVAQLGEIALFETLKPGAGEVVTENPAAQRGTYTTQQSNTTVRPAPSTARCIPPGSTASVST